MTEYKALKTTERKYYKYDETTLEDITNVNNAIYFEGATYPENIFDGGTTTWGYLYNGGSSVSGVAFVGQKNLTQKVKEIVFSQEYDNYNGSQNCCVSSAKIQISTDGETWTDVQTVSLNNGGNRKAVYTTNITIDDYTVPSTPYQMRLLANSGVIYGNSASWIVDEIRFFVNGTEEGTPEDYDFYKDIELCSSLTNTETKYYKYVDETWVRPTLTSNTSYGTITASNGSASAYALFNGSQVTIAWNGGTVSFVWELPHEVTFNQAQYQPVSTTSPVVYPVTAFYIDMLQDGSWVNVYSKSSPSASLTTVNITPIPTNSVRVRMTPYSGWYNPSGVRNVAFFGVAKTGVEESTSSDYDFYKDLTTYTTLEVQNGN